MVEFTDFIWWQCYSKKIAVIHANCHGGELKNFLEGNRDFMQQYCIYPIPPLMSKEIRDNLRLSDELLSHIHLFFYQDRRVEKDANCYMSPEFLKPKLSPDCKIFCIPNFVSLGKGIHQTQLSGFEERNLYHFYKDELLEEVYAMKKESTLEEMLLYVKQYSKSKSEVRKVWEENFERIKEKEKVWDIEISEYIMENYQKTPLFGDCSHPTRTLMNEVHRRIGKALGISVEESEFPNTVLDWFEGFVWDYVRDGLSLEWENPKEVRKRKVRGRVEGKTGYDLREFIMYYMYAWHDYIVK